MTFDWLTSAAAGIQRVYMGSAPPFETNATQRLKCVVIGDGRPLDSGHHHARHVGYGLLQLRACLSRY
jgi:hypothetical protein